MDKKKYTFGIDLGTTYSCIAYVDETGLPVVVNNQEGANTTPSVVSFEDPEHIVVGEIAKESAVISPDTTSALVKTLMGKSDFAIEVDGKSISPEEVSADILRKLTGDAAKNLDTEVKDVVITCPAYFGSAERTATKNAGKIAGLNVISIISEPTAAALYYGVAKTQETKTILVYDLGGGTFDVTVMRIDDGNIEVICQAGDHDLGGKDWDNAIINYLESEFRDQTGYEDEFQDEDMQDFRLKAEAAKQQLSGKEKVPVSLAVAGQRARIELTRETFEELTAVHLQASIDKTDEAIAIAKEKGYTIDEILLVGGSTRMPQVEKALVAKYDMEPKILEPDEAVAKGAAIYAVGEYENKVNEWKQKVESGEIDTMDQAAQKEAEQYQEAATVSTLAIPGLHGQKMSEVVTIATTKSYAIKVVMTTDGKQEPKCCNLIVKNTTMEDGVASVTQQFGTLEANQATVEIEVYESDYADQYYDVDEDLKLGDCSLEMPANLPAGSPILVTLTLNSEGILEVTGKDKTSNNEIHATMQATAGTTMSDEAVEAARAKATGITVE